MSDMTAVISALGGLAAVDPHSLTDTELRERLIEIERASRMLEGLRAGTLAVFDARGIAAADNAVTTAAWLRHRCQLGYGDARARVSTARALRGLPGTAAALAEGRVGFRQAAAIAALTLDVDPADVAAGEPALLEAAAQSDPTQLRRALLHFRHSLAPDTLVRDEEQQFQQRRVDLSKSWQASWALGGTLTDETGARFATVLHGLAAPAGPDDTRTPGQRRHDALDLMLRQLLEHGQLPQSHGRKPQLQVTADLATLLELPGAPAADLTWAGPISGDAARRIACDAQITRIITDGRSQILDVGRTTRVVPPAIRIALEIRDGGCVTDGCTIPAQYCDAHHIIHWLHLGETSLDNCCLLCPYHHRRYHEGKFTLHQLPDGSWQSRPPPLATAA